MTSLRKFGYAGSLFTLFVLLIALVLPGYAQQKNDNGFSLQVTPSPLIGSLTPGQKTTNELKIRNTNSVPETLRMGIRNFQVNEQSGEIELGNTEPEDVKNVISFSDPTFVVQPGEWFTQKIIMDTPADAGFTYSFVVTISRDKPTETTPGNTTIEGSVAVFALYNVQREGATRSFEVTEFTASQRAYEYLPATFTVKLKNNGNTLVQPKGNIFIQRGSNDATPLAVLPLNPNGGYIIPGTSRSIESQWTDGFPVRSQVEGSEKTTVVWDWNNGSKLRFGRYTAKLVAIYDDGQRDIPIQAEVTFWVIPWKLIAGILLIAILMLVGVISIIRTAKRKVSTKKPKANATHDEATD